MSQPFASDIQIIEQMDSRITNNFEVTIVELNNKLIHSERQGVGMMTDSWLIPMTESKMNSIAVHIEDALEGL